MLSLARRLPSWLAALVVASATLLAISCLPGEAPRRRRASLDLVAASPAGPRMLAEAARRPFVARPGGYASTKTPRRALGDPLETELPLLGREPIGLRLGTTVVSVHREHALAARARLERGVVIYEQAAAGVDSLWSAAGDGTEELLVVDADHAPLAYRLELPAGWQLVAGEGHSARAVDEAGRVRLQVSATDAWDARGEPVPLRLSVDGDRLRLELGEVEAWPAVVDPTWLSASAPVQLRQNHTASLMGDGTVWLVGGSNGGPLASVERFDPATGEASLVTSMPEPRAGHTATVLGDGRLLVTGGSDGNADLASTLLIDPVTGAVTDGPTMAGPRDEHAAIRLGDGRVLIAGGGTDSLELFDPTSDSFGAPVAVTFAGAQVTAARLTDGTVLMVTIGGAHRFDPTSGSVAATANPADANYQPVAPVLMPLRDGTALLTGGGPCFSVGGPATCSKTSLLFDPSGSGSWTATGDTGFDRTGAAAARLPDGNVLLAGGSDFVSSSPDLDSFEIYDTAAGSYAISLDTMARPHEQATATLLPSGVVFVVGGNQAGADMYQPSRGRFADGPVFDPNIPNGRTSHTATRLADGRVLFTGGDGLGEATTQIFDPSNDTFASGGDLVLGRQEHRAILLEDGTVLVVGDEDPTVSTERYDPTADTSTASGDLNEARATPALVRLPDGRILVAGGGPSSVELYDPAAGTFDLLPDDLGAPTDGASAVLLVDGRVLVVGAQTAHVFDPASDSLSAIGAPGSVYADPTLQLLSNGQVLLSGGNTLAAELFDPTSDSFSFTGTQFDSRIAHAVAPLPHTDVMVTGGKQIAVEPSVYDEASFFTPAAAPDGAFHDTSSGLTARDHTATLLLDGRVAIAGGLACDEPFICFPNQTLRFFVPGDLGAAPTVSTAPASATPGEDATLTGTGFEPVEAGGHGASVTGSPVVVWQPEGWDVMVFGRVSSFSDTSITLQLPPSVYAGDGYIRVITDGVPSTAVPLALADAPLGTGCSFGADCPTGSCVDGVCCDTACEGVCEGCTAELKGSGVDGECGAVPPERFADDGCFLTSGAPCESADACDTGFCVDGVCCNAICDQQCEACDVSGSVGTCVPVTGLPHGDRPACDAEPPADVCDTKLCDGMTRDSCEATVGPCDPYVCTAEGCLGSCEDDQACAVGFHCEDGECVAGSCDGSVATRPDGTLLECAPYTCRIDGTCRTTCANVNDCVEPFACNFEGRCVQRPLDDELSSSCACEAVGRPTGTRASWALLLGLGLLAARRRRRALVVAAGVVAGALLMGPGVAWGQTDGSGAESGAESGSEGERKAEARARFQKGIALIREEAWAEALAEFLASRQLYPTRVATTNAAIAYTQLRRFAEALQAYESLMRQFPDMPKAEMDEVQKSVSSLRARVGTVEIDQAEPGATIVIDSVTRGSYPPPGPLRVSAGSHIVRVVKEGYEPFEARVDVAGGGTARVEAPLTALTESGQLNVTEAQGRELAVLVDDIEVGKTPWEGRLSVGSHSVRLRGEGDLGTPPMRAPIRAQETTSLSLEAVVLNAALRVEPIPANATVFIDAVAVGRGIWEGKLPAGKHKIEVREDGFIPVARTTTLADGEPAVVSVELERIEEELTIPGDFVIDAAAIGLLAPTFGGDVTGQCGEGCSQGVGLGIMGRLHAGYEFPFGLGLGVMGGFATATQKIEGRTARVQPVGLEPRVGEASDSLRVQGPFVGAFASYLFDGDYPILIRLGTGPLFAKVRDQRTGSFTLDDGNDYQAGPVVQEPSAIHLAILPEVKAGIRLDEHFTLMAGLEVPLFVALERPAWDPEREVDAATDGIGAYNTEALTSRIIAMAALSLGARAQF